MIWQRPYGDINVSTHKTTQNSSKTAMSFNFSRQNSKSFFNGDPPGQGAPAKGTELALKTL